MICPNCGKEVTNGAKFCPECGAAISDNNTATNSFSQEQPKGFEYNNNQQAGAGFQNNGFQNNGFQGNYQNNSYLLNVSGIQKRDLVVAILLTIVTCGIYAIYWFIVLTDETNQITNQPEATSGGLAFVFSLITCGIYYFYWSYKMGEKVDIIKGNPNGSTSILFLVLSIVGFGIVNYFIAQDAINNLVGAN
ncbi:DUF4234 domain-containing protein [Butyrivibrio sp. XBB1001]|uniref:DUF4234 domain-containing protein n=1 Tax=Butyrivibrio sp. XBB1001 TaxID=1280682 RepID=UPI00042006A5|nr:DUF4234 domain-containing protein [Butyrivibrio sp. XBB1001]